MNYRHVACLLFAYTDYHNYDSQSMGCKWSIVSVKIVYLIVAKKYPTQTTYTKLTEVDI